MMKRFFVNELRDYAGNVPPAQCNPCEIQRRLLNIVEQIVKHQGRSEVNCDGGIYVGVGGVGYMCWKMSSNPCLAADKQELLKSALKYLAPAIAYADKSSCTDDLAQKYGFLLGNTGVYVTAALVGKSMGDSKELEVMLKRFDDAAKQMIPVNVLGDGSDELLVGRAGILAGMMTLRKYVGAEAVCKETLCQVYKSVIKSGREYSKRHNSVSPLMYSYYDTEYLGAAHGLSGILQMLLCFPEILDEQPRAEKYIRDSVDYMITLQQPNGNFPASSDEIRRNRSACEELVHWCHGAPGVAFLMAKAYLRWKDNEYLEACIRCGEVVWEKGLLRKGPGICHGVSGSGYVFLLLHQITGDKKHLHRAVMFADFMESNEFKTLAKTPDNPYSLFEGLAGTACFLSDLMNPETAYFPFFNVD